MNYISFAFRNLLRHRKRSLVTLMTICLGFTALGVIGGVLNNIFSRLKAREIVVEKLGHITIAKAGYFEKGSINPEQFLWSQNELKAIKEIIQADEEVVLATPRLKLFGIATTGEASTIFITESAVPEDDQILIKTPVDGRIENAGAVALATDETKRSEVAVGSELARLLELKQGSDLTLLTTTKDGMANAVDVKVAMIYNTGNPATDDKFVLTNFYLLQQLADVEGAERLVVTLKNPDRLPEVQQRLIAKIKQGGFDVEAQGWEDQSKSYKKVKKMFAVIFRVLMVIITVIILLTIMNTMQMSVAERTKEIGTLRAIGMRKIGIVKAFCVEGIMLALAGCFLSIPILLLISFILATVGISFIPPVASVPVPLVLMFDVPKIGLVLALFVVATTLASYFVSSRIAKQKVIVSLSTFN